MWVCAYWIHFHTFTRRSLSVIHTRSKLNSKTELESCVCLIFWTTFHSFLPSSSSLSHSGFQKSFSHSFMSSLETSSELFPFVWDVYNIYIHIDILSELLVADTAFIEIHFSIKETRKRTIYSFYTQCLRSYIFIHISLCLSNNQWNGNYFLSISLYG